MRESNFYKNLESRVLPFMTDNGFKYKAETFFRNRGELRDIIVFDYSNSCYRVFCGIKVHLNEPFDPEEPPKGALLVKYFSGVNLSTKPRDFKIKDSASLHASLDRFLNIMNLLLILFLRT